MEHHGEDDQPPAASDLTEETRCNSPVYGHSAHYQQQAEKLITKSTLYKPATPSFLAPSSSAAGEGRRKRWGVTVDSQRERRGETGLVE
jgi:hypothetical protein